MPKKVSDKEKEQIVESFLNGINIKEIAVQYGFSPITITKNLKLILGENKFSEIKNLHSNQNQIASQEKILASQTGKSRDSLEESFFEIVPIITEVQFDKQKECSSKPLEEIKLPSVLYMLVDKRIELVPKLLRDYPKWEFLPEEDLQRKTIEIFSDLKTAKRKCNKEEKVIKIPNPNVFKIVAPILISKGISRIINEDELIAL